MKTIVTQIRQKRLMALVLFLLVGMTSVFAQKQVNVSGRITDELNEPMIGVVTRLTYSKATDNLKLADGGAIPNLKTAVCPWNNPS